jgi:hypothetical protein
MLLPQDGRGPVRFNPRLDQHLEPISAKGFPEPVSAYLVRSARPRTFRTAVRSVHGAEARMVGRDVELWPLKRAFVRVTAQAQTHLVTVSGEAGIGKSRLLFSEKSPTSGRQK